VTASEDGTSNLWLISGETRVTGINLLTFARHTSIVYDAAWSPDGTRVITASGDSTAKLWRIWPTLSELVVFADQCCVIRELSLEERQQFGLPLE
jgi:WD40 repeat protein